MVCRPVKKQEEQEQATIAHGQWSSCKPTGLCLSAAIPGDSRSGDQIQSLVFDRSSGADEPITEFLEFASRCSQNKLQWLRRVEIREKAEDDQNNPHQNGCGNTSGIYTTYSVFAPPIHRQQWLCMCLSSRSSTRTPEIWVYTAARHSLRQASA